MFAVAFLASVSGFVQAEARTVEDGCERSQERNSEASATSTDGGSSSSSSMRVLAPHGISLRNTPSHDDRMKAAVAQGDVVNVLEYWVKTDEGWLPVYDTRGNTLLEPLQARKKLEAAQKNLEAAMKAMKEIEAAMKAMKEIEAASAMASQQVGAGTPAAAPSPGQVAPSASAAWAMADASWAMAGAAWAKAEEKATASAKGDASASAPAPAAEIASAKEDDDEDDPGKIADRIRKLQADFERDFGGPSR
eukprot:TRINITY_DN27582_c0_g2_i3.p1 TRINITY_DN27582_c0_g2~~TRINITY_DN27582_c0_g2_i3.p1  ORF type:complete len:281 (+),score=78.10 TRINITY_DN27582_c0_g2_i3:96-845(+)